MSKFSQKGISLYLSIMIMVILLSIILGTSGILLRQLKTMKGIENSVIAFYAAETGIERVLMDRKDNPNTEAGHYNGSIGDAAYEITVTSLSPPDNFKINSVGIYKGTQRAIQVIY